VLRAIDKCSLWKYTVLYKTGWIEMAKTIQVRIDDEAKSAADELFAA
jgi:hypothetical protein